MTPRVGAWLKSITARLRDPAFWWRLTSLVAVILTIGLLLDQAIEQHAAYLRLRPLLCEGGISDETFILVAMVTPVWFGSACRSWAS